MGVGIGDPPFVRGMTFYDGATIDSANLGGVEWEGREYWLDDLDFSVYGIKPYRSGMKVKVRVVRNVSGITLLPKQAVRYQESGSRGHRVDGYTRTTAQAFAGIVDEFLPSTGVVNNDLFFLVVEGPSMCLTRGDASISANIGVGDRVVATTDAAASTVAATTASAVGRINSRDLTGATSLLIDQSENAIGRAMTARTTANTNQDILVDVRKA